MMKKGALSEEDSPDLRYSTKKHLFSLTSLLSPIRINCQEETKTEDSSLEMIPIENIKFILQENERLKKKLKITTKEKDELCEDKKHLHRILDLLEKELQSVKHSNSELQAKFELQEEELSKSKLLLKSECYKYIANPEILQDSYHEAGILKQEILNLEKKLKNSRNREKLYEKANSGLRERMMNTQNTFQRLFTKTKNLNLRDLTEKLGKTQEKSPVNPNCTLLYIKHLLDSVYKNILLEIQSSSDQLYTITNEGLCKIEREINLIIMILHENIEENSLKTKFPNKQPKNSTNAKQNRPSLGKSLSFSKN